MVSKFRLGIDVGGTFTDLILVNEKDSSVVIQKIPSTKWPVEAIVTGCTVLKSKYGIDLSAVDYFSHGTTLAVNTLLERSGVPVGVLTTKGFRDILELRRLRLSKTNDLFVNRPTSLVPRRYVKEINERILANGSIYVPIKRSEVEKEVEKLVQDGNQAIVISFLHSYRNSIHELKAKEWITEGFSGLYVCASSEVWPQQREYERSLVSVINAYIGNYLKDYFHSLETEFSHLGIGCRIFSTKSNGGVMSAKSAAEKPVETLLSGPAAGVIGASYIGHLIDDNQIVTLDMGGTSVDLSVFDGGIPYSTENMVGDFPVIVPAVDVTSIGAGGGSIAWLDSEGVLKVGPRSAGSMPGPACYDQGGELPTITDAYLSVGIIHPDRFLGGQMKLDPSLAATAIKKISDPLGLSVIEAADAIISVATSKIYAELLPQMARRGADPRDFSLLAYGGAGPTHVFLLARELNIRRIIIPPTPGLLCALGCLVADLRADFITTVWKDCEKILDEELHDIYRGLEESARQWLEKENVAVEQIHFIHSADMCYVGQSFEINVILPNSSQFLTRTKQVVERYHQQYERAYGYADTSASVKLLEARLQIVGITPKPKLKIISHEKSTNYQSESNRRVYDSGACVNAHIYQRYQLNPGEMVRGPAIIEQYDTTTYIPENFIVNVDRELNLIGTKDNDGR